MYVSFVAFIQPLGADCKAVAANWNFNQCFYSGFSSVKAHKTGGTSEHIVVGKFSVVSMLDLEIGLPGGGGGIIDR